jgi:hypothetical protein
VRLCLQDKTHKKGDSLEGFVTGVLCLRVLSEDGARWPPVLSAEAS